MQRIPALPDEGALKAVLNGGGSFMYELVTHSVLQRLVQDAPVLGPTPLQGRDLQPAQPRFQNSPRCMQ